MLWRALWAAPEHIAIDGKTLRGRSAARRQCSAFATALSAAIGDLVVAPEANEITAAMALASAMPKIDRSSY
jgi:hypothetical protein